MTGACEDRIGQRSANEEDVLGRTTDRETDGSAEPRRFAERGECAKGPS